MSAEDSMETAAGGLARGEGEGSATAVIAARSERQAMDWSLVLTSQGIEVAIERGQGARGWSLVVPESRVDVARRLIRQYRLENRRFVWSRDVQGAPLEFHAGAFLWAFGLVVIHVLSVTWLGERGEFATRAVSEGQWWRGFTAVWLHHDLPHLMSNAVFGILVTGFAMARFGVWATLVFGVWAGVAGNALGFALRNGEYVGRGASGMVMGVIGMLGAQSIAHWKESRHATRFVFAGLLGGVFLFLTLGSDPRSDVIAHFGGFLAGMVIGGAAVWLDAVRRDRWWAVVFWAMVLGTWWLARVR